MAIERNTKKDKKYQRKLGEGFDTWAV